MNRKDAQLKALEMISLAQQNNTNERQRAAGVLGISTHDTVTVVRLAGDRYNVADNDNGDGAADLNEYEATTELTHLLTDHD